MLPPSEDDPVESAEAASSGGIDLNEIGTEEPSSILWLVYLLFRPRVFFKHFVVDAAPLLTAVCAWIYGITNVLDRIETQELRGRPIVSTWAEYWGYALVGGVLGGLFYFILGGWWYRVRLEWCGAEADKALARRVYLYASQVYAIPAVVATLVNTARHPTPAVAAASEMSWWEVLVVFSLFWSVWVSYVGARTVFTIRRGAARIWFLILPGAVYAAALLGLGFLALAAEFGPADVANPLVHDSETLTFSYPGNWWIDTDDQNHDPNGKISVQPIQDAVLLIILYESEENINTELESSLESYRDSFQNWCEVAPFVSWGNYRGLGRAISAEIDGEPYSLRVFVSDVADNAYLEVQELCIVADEGDVLPGFELIRSSFRIKE